jgi:hydrogenase expression/formation protein HypC
MCLGVPGRVEEISGEDPIFRTATVSFGGTLREVSLAGVPRAEVGDWVIVHAGFALSILREEEAMEVFEYLRQISEMGADELPPEEIAISGNDIPEIGT